MAASFGIRSWIEGGVIASVVLLNIVVGFFQEFKAAKTMDSLRSLSSPTAAAVRDGSDLIVPTAEIVHGDMVEMKMGDTIPADIRWVPRRRLFSRSSLHPSPFPTGIQRIA
jgi:P-type Na+/K+ transporter